MAFWSEWASNLSGVDGGRDLPAYETISALGFDSITHYQYVHFTDTARPYPEILKDVRREWKAIEARSPIPYFPHVSLGWDNNPRYKETTGGIMRENTPENVEQALRMAKAYADAHPGQPPLVTVNAWNEWPESSYLMPDDLYGYGYLQAVRRVFGTASA